MWTGIGCEKWIVGSACECPFLRWLWMGVFNWFKTAWWGPWKVAQVGGRRRIERWCGLLWLAVWVWDESAIQSTQAYPGRGHRNIRDSWSDQIWINPGQGVWRATEQKWRCTCLDCQWIGRFCMRVCVFVCAGLRRLWMWAVLLRLSSLVRSGGRYVDKKAFSNPISAPGIEITTYSSFNSIQSRPGGRRRLAALNWIQSSTNHLEWGAARKVGRTKRGSNRVHRFRLCNR